MSRAKYQNPLVAVALLLTATFIAIPLSAHADEDEGIERMTICHHDMDGVYELKSLPIQAAIKHLAKHDHDREPFVGDDGSETCVLVEEPPELPTCDVTLNDGTETTITDYVLASNQTLTRYDSTSGACRLFYTTEAGADVPIVQLFNGGEPFFLEEIRFDDGSRPVVNSEEQYNSCAAELQRVAQQAELLTDVEFPCEPYMGIVEAN